jgi:hypothetical protein
MQYQLLPDHVKIIDKIRLRKSMIIYQEHWRGKRMRNKKVTGESEDLC